MTLYAIGAIVYVEAPNGADPEDIATQFDSGFENAIRDFPGADVIGVDVTGIRLVKQQEADEKGLTE